jgi:hypothetical protein
MVDVHPHLLELSDLNTPVEDLGGIQGQTLDQQPAQVSDQPR